MSTERKVALVREAKGKHAVSSVLAALDLPRSTWYYHRKHGVSYTEKHADLKEPLETIAREHPEYGYRRTTAELTQGHGYNVNHKVVQRLHQEWDLPLMRSTRPPRPSGIRQVITAAGTPSSCETFFLHIDDQLRPLQALAQALVLALQPGNLDGLGVDLWTSLLAC